MSSYDKKIVVHAASANAADNADLLRIFVPAYREIEIYGLRALIGTTGDAGSGVELVNTANAILARVTMSGLSDTVAELNFSNGPINFTNNTSSGTFIKLRQDVAGGAGSLVTISMDLEFPGTKPRLA